MSLERRSSREIKFALAANRTRMGEDFDQLGHRLQEGMSPRRLLARHPILVIGAGALLGVIAVRRPAMLVRAASRLAGWGAPLLLSALVRREPDPS